MISKKLGFLVENIRDRSRCDDVFDPTELAQIAAVIEALLPTVEALETRPVPPMFRVIQGIGT